MTIYERFADLLGKKGLKAADISRATGLSSTVFSEWKKGKAQPKADKLQKIADALGVSMEFLLTGKDPEAFWDGPSDAPALTVEELRILELYRSLPADKQAEVLRYGKFLYTEAREERKKSSTSLREA